MNSHKNSRSEAVLVLGAGVSGLTCALRLKQCGFDVTVVAEKFAPEVTSVVAGALWEWPPAVCGHHQDQTSLARSKAWCMASYSHFADLARNPDTGVFMRNVVFYFRQPVEENPKNLKKMNELKEHVDAFVHDQSLIAANDIGPQLGLRDAYSHLAPLVDTDIYMRWLLNEVKQSGCRVIRQRISGDLKEQESELKKQFQVAAIVNCAGLGAAELANDPMYPLRGALIRVLNDGKSMPRITQAHCVSQGELNNGQGFIFVVPRGEDMLVLGGLAEPDEWDLEIGLHNHEPIRAMYQRCVEFMPVLKNARIDAAEPVRVGLRPYRKQNVRLEQEPGTRIVHNYGHGGAGVTFSWGCAGEVSQIVERLLGYPGV